MLALFKSPSDYRYASNAIFITVFLLLAYTITIGISAFILELISYSKLNPYIFGISQILFFILPIIYFARRTPIGLKKLIKIYKPRTIKIILLAIFGLVAIHLFLPGYMSLQEALMPENFKETYLEMRRSVDMFYKDLFVNQGFFNATTGFIIGAIIPGICEEFIFRGYFQNSLEREFKPFWAIAITAFLFAIIHFNIINLLPLFVIGIYLGILMYASKSIFIPMFIHFLNNAFSITLLHLYTVDEIININSEMSIGKSIIFMCVGILLLILVCRYLINLKSD